MLLVDKGFVNDARSAVSIKGMPAARIVATSVPSGCNVIEDMEAGITAAMDDIVAALCKPLSAEEKSPKKEVEKLSRIVFKGGLEEVNRFFYKRGWGDGLPIIPPTEEAVAEMLTGTDLPADHLVGKLVLRLGKATIEKIAINAVMAGALPTYMPLLIAGVQVLTEPTTALRSLGASTGNLNILNIKKIGKLYCGESCLQFISDKRQYWLGCSFVITEQTDLLARQVRYPGRNSP